MNKSLFAAVMLAAAMLAACSPSGNAPDKSAGVTAQAATGSVLQLPAGGQVVETINGVAVPQALLAAIAKGRSLDLDRPDQRQKALDELQQYILLAQQAPGLKVQQQSDLAALIEAARLQGVANAVLLAYSRSHPVDDAQVAKEYNDQISRVGDKTYKFTQLMFADQATADKAAAELRTGKPFPKVFDAYRAKARDAQSYPGVFPKQLPPELAQALAALAPGQATKAPVKTSLGWHLLYLESVDPFEPPSLDKVKDRIRDALEQKQAQAYLDSLKQSASITLVAPANAASAPPEVPRQGMGKAVSPAPAKASSTAQ